VLPRRARASRTRVEFETDFIFSVPLLFFFPADAQGASHVEVTYGFSETAQPPVAQTLIGIYKPGETESMKFAEANTWKKVCKEGVDGTDRCATSGTVKLTDLPQAEGRYKLVVAPYIPANEFGQSGYSPTLKDSNIIAYLTILSASATDDELSKASNANSPVALFQVRKSSHCGASRHL
jgi:hypothetical protein